VADTDVQRLMSKLLSGASSGRRETTYEAFRQLYKLGPGIVPLASLLPEKIIEKFVNTKDDIAKIAEKYGTSIELIEYRIKRLGLWRHYKGRNVEIDSSTKRP
jgi:hypothetical protein